MRAIYAAMLSLVLTGVAFVPVCMAAYFLTSPFRFGQFSADDWNSVRFSRVQAYLPPSATQIDMITTPHHHHAKFKVKQAELVDWMNTLWIRHGTRSPMTRTEAAFASPETHDHDDKTFRRLGMPTDRDFLKFEGPYQGDWGGPTLWFDPQSGTAWQYVGYW